MDYSNLWNLVTLSKNRTEPGMDLKDQGGLSIRLDSREFDPGISSSLMSQEEGMEPDRKWCWRSYGKLQGEGIMASSSSSQTLVHIQTMGLDLKIIIPNLPPIFWKSILGTSAPVLDLK